MRRIMMGWVAEGYGSHIEGVEDVLGAMGWQQPSRQGYHLQKY